MRKIIGLILVLTTLLFFMPQTASAAGPLTALSDTMSRLQKSPVYSDHTIKYTTPTGVAAGQNMQITMPTGFTIGSVDYTDIDVSWGASGTENELTLAGTCSGSTWGAAFTGQVLAITSCTGTITGTSKVIIEIGQNATGGGANLQIQNHATPATYTISIGGTFTDTGKIAIVILENDQVVVSTTIDPYLTFSLTQNTVSLEKSGGGNPDYQNTGYNINPANANTLAANTNANTGYTISYKGATLSANEGANEIDVMTGEGSVEGEEQFGINLRANTDPATGANKTGSGSATYASGYGDIDQFKFVADNTTTTLASAGAATASNIFTVTYIINVTETTEAGAYNTTITYICTGNF